MTDGQLLLQHDLTTTESLPLPASCAAFTVTFRLRAPIALIVVLAVLWLAAACTLFMLPVVWKPEKFAVSHGNSETNLVASGTVASVVLWGGLSRDGRDVRLVGTWEGPAASAALCSRLQQLRRPACLDRCRSAPSRRPWACS